jgi:hypothetical protein
MKSKDRKHKWKPKLNKEEIIHLKDADDKKYTEKLLELVKLMKEKSAKRKVIVK